MALSNEEKAIFAKGFHTGLNGHKALLQKVTKNLQTELEVIKSNQKRAVYGATGFFAISFIERFFWAMPSNLLNYGFGIYSGVGMANLLEKRPGYYRALDDALNAYQWVFAEKEVNFMDTCVQDFILLMLPLVNSEKLNQLEVKVEETKTEHMDMKASNLFSVNTAMNVLSYGAFFFAGKKEEGDIAKEPLPLKFFINQVREQIKEAKKFNYENYFYGEGYENFNTKTFINAGIEIAQNKMANLNQFSALLKK